MGNDLFVDFPAGCWLWDTRNPSNASLSIWLVLKFGLWTPSVLTLKSVKAKRRRGGGLGGDRPAGVTRAREKACASATTG